MSMLDMSKHRSTEQNNAQRKRNRGKEQGLALVCHITQTSDTLPPITPIDCTKRAWAHLRNNGRHYIGLARSISEACGK